MHDCDSRRARRVRSYFPPFGNRCSVVQCVAVCCRVLQCSAQLSRQSSTGPFMFCFGMYVCTYVCVYMCMTSSHRARQVHPCFGRPNFFKVCIYMWVRMSESYDVYEWVMSRNCEWANSQVWVSRVTYLWVGDITRMSYVWVSRMTCMSESCHVYVSEPLHMYGWVCHVFVSGWYHTYVIRISESYHVYEWVMSRICEGVTSHVWVSHITWKGESCHIYVSESLHVYESVVSRICGWVASRVCEWVILHVCVSHVIRMGWLRSVGSIKL